MEAKYLDLFVIGTDVNKNAIGCQIVDEFVQIDTYDTQAHHELGKRLKTDKRFNILGVATCGSDTAPSVAAAAAAAQVPGIPLEIARLTHDKRAVRDALEDAGLNCYQPAWEEYDSSLPAYGPDLHYQGPFPCIIKPSEERASRGVTIIRSEEDWLAGMEKVKPYGDVYLVEELLAGTEHSTEVIFGNDGEVLFFNIVDRYFDYRSGVPIEKGHINPTLLDDHAQQTILLMVLAAAKALGVSWGPFKIDLMLTKDGPKILEVCARLSGGYDSQWSSPITNRHPMRILLRLACGLPVEAEKPIQDAEGYGAVAAILQTHAGVLQHLRVPGVAFADANCRRDVYKDRGVILNVLPGDVIAPLDHNAARAGFVRVHGIDYWNTWKTAEAIAQTITESMEIT